MDGDVLDPGADAGQVWELLAAVFAADHEASLRDREARVRADLADAVRLLAEAVRQVELAHRRAARLYLRVGRGRFGAAALIAALKVDRPPTRKEPPVMTATTYHPDPEINKGVIADAIEAERIDLAAGYPPRRWRCICGTGHSRGHFGAIGVHRCLTCGYTGTGGVMLDDGEDPTP